MIQAAQKELSSKSISRNFISAIENKKAGLSINAAEVIADNLNKIIDDRAYTLPHITSDELLLSEEEQAIIIVKNGIIQLNEFNHESVNEFDSKVLSLEEIIDKYTMPEDVMYEFFESIIGFYYLSYKYEKAEVYLFKKIELASIKQNKIKFVESLLEKIKICIELNKNSNLLCIGKYTLDYMQYNNIDNPNYKKRIYFNMALSCRKLKEDTEGLYWISRLKEECGFSRKQLLDIVSLEGIFHRRLGNLNIAELKLKECLELSKIQNDLQDIAISYINLSFFYYKHKKDYHVAKLYIDKALEINENEVDDDGLTYIFSEATRVYMKLDESKMIYFFNRTLDKAILSNNSEIIVNITNGLFKYYEEKEDRNKIFEIIKVVDQKVNSELKNELGEIYIKAFKYLNRYLNLKVLN
ncbi:MAG TPA: hypothetical protein DCL31_06490 [Clostridium sp.]|nr:hypothetical protein [Clostridium sp.]